MQKKYFNLSINLLIIPLMLSLGACNSNIGQSTLTYMQSNTGFCSGGQKHIHNRDGTSTPLFMQNGKVMPCAG